MMELYSVQKAAFKLARLAGQQVMEGSRNGNRVVDFKGRRDLVTETDKLSERYIRSNILEMFPDHGFWGEEGGRVNPEASWQWIVDPLDGTTNFVHGFPHFCVSIAVSRDGKVMAAAVHDPNRDELFGAIRGMGATLNGNPIRVSRCEKLEEAMVSTGFPYDRGSDPDDNIDEFRKVSLKTQGTRRVGAAALDLCWVACGRLDGFWEKKLNSWDLAAGSLILSEAGGMITALDGGPYTIETRHVLATNGLIHDSLKDVLDD